MTDEFKVTAMDASSRELFITENFGANSKLTMGREWMEKGCAKSIWFQSRERYRKYSVVPLKLQSC
jgi:hypothetical protein